jgi:hypothetical protein
MTTRDRIFAEITAERQRQDEKWGEQNHPLTFPGSYRTPEFWHTEAESWKQTNDHRAGVRNADGYPADRNRAWDGILEEEVAEAFGSGRVGLQYAEFVQAAGVTVAILELLNRQCFEQTGHLASCSALDVDWVVTAPEACDCEPKLRYEPKRLDTLFDTWGIWDNREEDFWPGDVGNSEGDCRSRARALNEEWAMKRSKEDV